MKIYFLKSIDNHKCHRDNKQGYNEETIWAISRVAHREFFLLGFFFCNRNVRLKLVDLRPSKSKFVSRSLYACTYNVGTYILYTVNNFNDILCSLYLAIVIGKQSMKKKERTRTRYELINYSLQKSKIIRHAKTLFTIRLRAGGGSATQTRSYKIYVKTPCNIFASIATQTRPYKIYEKTHVYNLWR